MKLYVRSHRNNNQKVYLNLSAATRIELVRMIRSEWFQLHGEEYHVNQVIAEAESTNNTATGAIVGGLLGLIGGPIGMILGGTIGGAIGNDSDQTEIKKARQFNQSRL